MTAPAPRVHRDLAWAIRQQAKRAGEQTPSVRGADWRLATVTDLHDDGTVTADGILCRRMDTYTMPAVDDVIAITQSSSGNWLALGPPDPGGGRPWKTYTPAWTAGGTNPAIGNGIITGRYTLLPARTCTVAIRVVPGATTTFGSGGYLFSVPFPSADDVVEYVGAARLTAGSTYIGQAFLGADSSVLNVTFPATATTAANMSATSPATLDAGHILRISLTYQTV